ncbi:UNVERIFIED_CONTAM: F-box protein SKIP5 [Sesamum radiatum]|uniref:F-box protein SKIP5 n=1 Tax=Sesamum radiatum TaxID=300843 RepID=A0AAW2UCM6_SESRA
MEEDKPKFKKLARHSKNPFRGSHINNLDDGCLMLIFSFLSPIPDRYNTALVCHRWRFLACHPRLWLRVDRSVKDLSQPGVYPSIETAVSAARQPGDTILIAAGGIHRTSNIQIKKPLCLIGAGELPDDTTLICSRGSESAELLALITLLCHACSCGIQPVLKNTADSVTVTRTRIEGESAHDHVANLEETFEVLKKYKLKFDPAKCVFWLKGKHFLEFTVREMGIGANLLKIKAISEMGQPFSRVIGLGQ